ncbi:COA7 (predicted) [Pycnogonum litorale]
MSSYGYNFRKEEEVQEFLKNLGIEYRFSCYSEKKPDGCHLLGDYMEGIKKDYKAAGKVYGHSCNTYNFGKSCLKLGNYHLIGRGGCKQDDSEAFKLYEKGCRANCYESCVKAGIMLTCTDTTIPTDVNKALRYFETACQNGDGDSCHQVASLYINDKHGIKNMVKAFEYSIKACDSDNVYACANVSMMYDKGVGTTENKTLAKKYKEKALDLQDQLLNLQQQLKFGSPP